MLHPLWLNSHWWQNVTLKTLEQRNRSEDYGKASKLLHASQQWVTSLLKPSVKFKPCLKWANTCLFNGAVTLIISVAVSDVGIEILNIKWLFFMLPYLRRDRRSGYIVWYHIVTIARRDSLALIILSNHRCSALLVVFVHWTWFRTWFQPINCQSVIN